MSIPIEGERKSSAAVVTIHVGPKNHFPAEIHRQIFSYLKGEDVARASRVCKNWYPIAQEKELWKTICARENIDVDPEKYVEEYAAKYAVNRQQEETATLHSGKKWTQRAIICAAIATTVWSILNSIQVAGTQFEILGKEKDFLEASLNVTNSCDLSHSCVQNSHDPCATLLQSICERHDRVFFLAFGTPILVALQGLCALGWCLCYSTGTHYKVSPTCERISDLAFGSFSALVASLSSYMGILPVSFPSFITGSLVTIQGICTKKAIYKACGKVTQSVCSRVQSCWRYLWR